MHREAYYLTVEHMGTDGDPTALCVRIASNVGATGLLETLRRDTGRPVDSSASSLVGLPLYARLAVDGLQTPPAFGSHQGSVTKGTEVFLELRRDAGYEIVKGRLVGSSASHIEVAVLGETRTAPAADVVGITTTRSMRGRGKTRETHFELGARRVADHV